MTGKPLTRKDYEELHRKEVALLVEGERIQKRRKKYIFRLRQQFESMPIIVEERFDELILKSQCQSST